MGPYQHHEVQWRQILSPASSNKKNHKMGKPGLAAASVKNKQKTMYSIFVDHKLNTNQHCDVAAKKKKRSECIPGLHEQKHET